MTDLERLYFEDLEVGRTWEVGSASFTAAGIRAFAEQFDPQPIHLDEAAGRRHFDGLIASGWHTAAACMRPFAEHVLHRVAIIAALGIDDLVWRRAVRPGDELDVTVTVHDKRVWDESRGQVRFELVAKNQAPALVHSRLDKVLVERR